MEYGIQFSELCREKFKDYSEFSVITNKFEDVSFSKNAYDLVYSASAFHWIPESIGYTKVFSMLKSGGIFARFANHPYRAKNDTALAVEMDRIYAEYYYPFHHKKPAVPTEYSEKQAMQRATTAEKYGFTNIDYALFHRTRTFSASEYSILLGTYSDHIAIEQNIREKFFFRNRGCNTQTWRLHHTVRYHRPAACKKTINPAEAFCPCGIYVFPALLFFISHQISAAAATTNSTCMIT